MNQRYRWHSSPGDDDVKYDSIGFICPNCKNSECVDGDKPIPKYCAECNKGWINFLVRKCDYIGMSIDPPPVPDFVGCFFWERWTGIRTCTAKVIYNYLGIFVGVFIGILSAYYLIHNTNLANIAVGVIAIAIGCVSSFFLYCLTSALLGITVWILVLSSYCAFAFLVYKIIIAVVEGMRH